MSTEKKFDEIDRRAVIHAVEEQLGVKLTPVGKRRKWLQDDDHRSFWVLGGYGEWHGIAEDMMEAESDRPTGGRIVIAVRGKEAIRIYIGPTAPFVSHKDKLYRAAKTTGQYQFTFTERAPHLHINQLQAVALQELISVPVSAETKRRGVVVRRARKLIDGLSPANRATLLDELNK